MESILDPLINEGVKALFALLITVLLPLAWRLLKKAGISLDIEKQQRLEAAARAAALRVEETAAAQIKAKVRTWTGPEKLQAAIAEVMAKKLPRVDQAEAERIVKAVLPTLGLGATELGKALRTPK